MNRSAWLSAALLLLPCVAAAQSHSVSVVKGFDGKEFPNDPSLAPAATYTPDVVSQSAAAHGWIEFDDSPQARVWMAYMADAKQPRAAWVALKQAEKGLSHGFTGLTILSGEVLCGADGSAPNYAHVVTAFKYAANGAPLAADGPVDSLALTPGTQFGEAARLACSHLSRAQAPAPSKAAPKGDGLFHQMDQTSQGR